MLGGEKRAFHVHRHHPVPILFTGLSDGFFDADAGVIHQNVQVPEIELDPRHEISDARLPGDVSLNKDDALGLGFV